MEEQETKKCRQCQLDIPKKAKKCGHCSSDARTPLIRSKGFWILMGTIGIIFLSTVWSADPQSAVVTPNYESTPVFKPYTATVDNSELAGTGITDINVWNSYSDRTLKFALTGGETVEVTSKDRANNYCRISHDNQSGWLSCDWLK